MIDVFLYLLRTTSRNRFVMRLSRLREPRYLVPFLVSILWFGTWVLRPMFRHGRTNVRFGWGMLPPHAHEAFVVVGGLAIFAWVVLMWIVPDKKAALAFSPAELHFLFPAPITRRQLVQYKLLQAQVGIFFGAFISAFFFSGARLLHPEGWARVLTFWLFFAIAHLHGIASSFVRTDLIESGWSGVRRRAVSIAVAAVVVGAVVISARSVWPVLASAAGGWFGVHSATKPATFAEVATALARVGSTGIASVILWPFMVLPRLLLATTPMDFLRYAVVGIELLVIHYLWVIHTDTSFEEASLELSQKMAERRDARRQIRRTGGVLVKNARGFPWKLSPTGRPEIALVWKNLVNLTRVTPVRALFALSAFILAMVTWLIQVSHERGGLWITAAALSALIAAFTAVMGPIFLRNDLREDLFRIDAIKTMPIAGHAIVWGEILGSWSALALLEVLLLAVGAGALLMSGAPTFEKVSAPWLFMGAAAALLVLPGVTMVAVGLQNALVVIFPAWVALGNTRARGLEASGQRILTLFGTTFALAIVVLPAAASGGLAAWLLARFLGPACLIVGAVIAAAWMVAEVMFACRLLGGVVDRIDPSTAGIEAEDA